MGVLWSSRFVKFAYFKLNLWVSKNSEKAKLYVYAQKFIKWSQRICLSVSCISAVRARPKFTNFPYRTRRYHTAIARTKVSMSPHDELAIRLVTAFLVVSRRVHENVIPTSNCDAHDSPVRDKSEILKQERWHHFIDLKYKSLYILKMLLLKF